MKKDCSKRYLFLVPILKSCKSYSYTQKRNSFPKRRYFRDLKWGMFTADHLGQLGLRYLLGTDCCVHVLRQNAFLAFFFFNQRLLHCSWDMNNPLVNSNFLLFFYCFQFSIFSFQQNKQYPNSPQVRKHKTPNCKLVILYNTIYNCHKSKSLIFLLKINN